MEGESCNGEGNSWSKVISIFKKEKGEDVDYEPEEEKTNASEARESTSTSNDEATESDSM